MATKHFCDRCGKETCDPHDVRILLDMDRSRFDSYCRWQPAFLCADLCEECLKWLKANWPFKGQ